MRGEGVSRQAEGNRQNPDSLLQEFSGGVWSVWGGQGTVDPKPG